MNKSNPKQYLITLASAFLIFNLVFLGFRLWYSLFLLGLLIDFIFIVMLAEEGSKFIAARHATKFERSLAIGFPILVLVGWELTVRAGILNPLWFPPPSKIAVALWQLIISYNQFTKTSLMGRPWLIPSMFEKQGWAGIATLAQESDLFGTLFRVVAGFILGFIPGIILGVVMGVSRSVRIMLNSILSAVYVLPKIMIFPIMMLMFADPFGEGPKIAVVAISAFFLVAINTMAGVAGVDNVYLEAGRNYGANRWQMFRHVIIPGALPVIFAGLRLALGTALIVVVSIEFIRAKTGVGYLTFYYWEIMDTPKMYAGLVLVMLIGVLLNEVLQWIETVTMPWQKGRSANS